MQREAFERSLRALVRHTPFHPFTVEVTSEARFEILHPEALAFNGGLAAYILPDSAPSLFDHESVSQLPGNASETAMFTVLMNTDSTSSERRYRLSFIINTAVGTFLLFLSAVSYVLEHVYPAMRGELVWGFLWTAVLCLFIASLHHAKSKPAAWQQP